MSNFTGWAITKQLFNKITEILPSGTILELGSGKGTQELAHYGYKMYSIEHDKYWLNRYYTKYIYAPIVNEWYDPECLINLPKYDLLLIDGPDSIDRHIFLNYISLFNTNVPIILDNVDFPPVEYLMKELSREINRKYEVFTTKRNKFGVIK
jgi:hypothetical protein